MRDLEVDLSGVTVLFGPNAAGKSNVIDALQVLSRIATERTIEEALGPPVRGFPIEMFSLPQGGVAELLEKDSARFSLQADIERPGSDRRNRFRYGIEVGVVPRTGTLTNAGEYLTRLTRAGEPTGTPRIEREGELFRIRANRQGHPRHREAPLNYALVSDPTLTSPYFRDIDTTRAELSSWRSYYFDPSAAMRSAAPPSEVSDIGPRGEHLAAFLYRLKQEWPERFDATTRAVRQVIPSIRQIDVELDSRRGTLELVVYQEGVRFSSRIVSEGTLRILALACIALSPIPAGLIAVEEPENGVHPRRIELVARFLMETARRTQVVVTTHSPTFLAEMLRMSREGVAREARGIGLFACLNEGGATVLRPFSDPGPLFTDAEVARALSERSEEAIIDALYVRGWLDG